MKTNPYKLLLDLAANMQLELQPDHPNGVISKKNGDSVQWHFAPERARTWCISISEQAHPSAPFTTLSLHTSNKAARTEWQTDIYCDDNGWWIQTVGDNHGSRTINLLPRNDVRVPLLSEDAALRSARALIAFFQAL